MKINSSNSALSAIKDLYFEVKDKKFFYRYILRKIFSKIGKIKKS